MPSGTGLFGAVRAVSHVRCHFGAGGVVPVLPSPVAEGRSRGRLQRR